MPRQVYLYDPPERFVIGTVGEPGERVFYLQAREGARLTSVVLEKEQAMLLAEKITELLDEVGRRHPDLHIADMTLTGAGDLEPLETPITEDFRVGALGLGWNSVTDRVVIEAHAVSEGDGDVPDIEDDEDTEASDCLRVRITAEMARAFAIRAGSVVSAGRPPCPFCHLPLDPKGHICPRANGYRR